MPLRQKEAFVGSASLAVKLTHVLAGGSTTVQEIAGEPPSSATLPASVVSAVVVGVIHASGPA